MTVILFDPSRRPAAGEPEAETSCSREVEACIDIRTATKPMMERRALRQAMRRIGLLERTLIATLRENASNWARAERAESMLESTPNPESADQPGRSGL